MTVKTSGRPTRKPLLLHLLLSADSAEAAAGLKTAVDLAVNGGLTAENTGCCCGSGTQMEDRMFESPARTGVGRSGLDLDLGLDPVALSCHRSRNSLDC